MVKKKMGEDLSERKALRTEDVVLILIVIPSSSC